MCTYIIYTDKTTLWVIRRLGGELAKGLTKGLTIGLTIGLAKGFTKGLTIGLTKGFTKRSESLEIAAIVSQQ